MLTDRRSWVIRGLLGAALLLAGPLTGIAQAATSGGCGTTKYVGPDQLKVRTRASSGAPEVSGGCLAHDAKVVEQEQVTVSGGCNTTEQWSRISTPVAGWVPTLKLTTLPPNKVKVLLIGDSMMAQSGPFAKKELESAGCAVEVVGVPGTGLMPDWWLGRIDELVTQHDPDYVVTLFVGNYFPPYIKNPDGTEILPRTPEFDAYWTQQDVELTRRAIRRGARMFYVSPPPQGADWQGSDHVYELHQRVAATYPTTGYLSVGRWVADRYGKYVHTWPRTDGLIAQIRAEDRGHFAPEGAEVYGARTAWELGRAVYPRFPIPRRPDGGIPLIRPYPW